MSQSLSLLHFYAFLLPIESGQWVLSSLFSPDTTTIHFLALLYSRGGSVCALILHRLKKGRGEGGKEEEAHNSASSTSTFFAEWKEGRRGKKGGCNTCQKREGKSGGCVPRVTKDTENRGKDTGKVKERKGARKI